MDDVVRRVKRALRLERLRQRLFLREIADELGVDENAVSKALKGDADLKLRTVQRIARAMGYDTRVLFEPRADYDHSRVRIGRRRLSG